MIFQAPEEGLIAPDLVVYLDIPPEVIFLIYYLFMAIYWVGGNKCHAMEIPV